MLTAPTSPVPATLATLRERLVMAHRMVPTVSFAGLPYGKVRTARDRGARRSTYQKGL